MRLTMQDPRPGFRPRVAAALWAAALVATPADAFYQETTLEGRIGTDISGVWLIVADTAAEFRVRVSREIDDSEVPVAVEALAGRHSRVVGKDGSGVVVTKILDPKLASGGALIPGDVIVAVNGKEIADPAEFRRAAASPSRLVIMQARRPALQQTKAALWKISYEIDEAAAADGAISEELKVEMLGQRLPFEDELDRSRRKRDLWDLKETHLAALRQNWHTLPVPDPLTFVGGKHRVVGASAYDQALAGDANLVNTGFAVVSDMRPNPVLGGSGKSIWVHGFQSVGSDAMDGTLVEAAMASAPFPISVEFKGRFRAVRIDDYSDKDVKHRLDGAKKEEAEDLDSFELEPDIPAGLN